MKIKSKILSVCYKTRNERKTSAVVGLQKDGKTSTLSVPRLVLLAFKGEPPASDTRVKRTENDAENNRLENLSW